MNAYLNAARSEAIRLRTNWKLPAAAVALAAVATAFVFSGDGIGPNRGTETPADTATNLLEAADGSVGGLDIAGTLIALLALVLWALSIARDLQTGSIRVLLVTQPKRGVYLLGKLITLAVVTVAMVTASVAVSVGVAYIAAAGNDVAISAWEWSYVGSAIVNTSLAALVWGSFGAAIALLARSAAAAIAGGLGYMLLGENLIGSVWSSASEWLPSGTIDTLIAGGTETVTYSRSLLLTIAYAAIAIIGSLAIITKRDITD